MLDRAVAQYEEADLNAALHTFDAAARNADLSVEELLLLFEMRALVHHALGAASAMREDLARLAAVRPSYQLGPLAPPGVRKAFEELLETSPRVELRIEEELIDRNPWMVARVMNVPAGLVDHVTLNCGVGPKDTAISRTSQGNEARVPLPRRSVRNRCDATARTRQGGVVFRAFLGGPRVPADAGPDVFQMPEYQENADTVSVRKRKRWPWFVAAAAVVVAGGVTAGVVLSNRSSSGQPTLGEATVSW